MQRTPKTALFIFSVVLTIINIVVFGMAYTDMDYAKSSYAALVCWAKTK